MRKPCAHSGSRVQPVSGEKEMWIRQNTLRLCEGLPKIVSSDWTEGTRRYLHQLRVNAYIPRSQYKTDLLQRTHSLHLRKIFTFTHIDVSFRGFKQRLPSAVHNFRTKCSHLAPIWPSFFLEWALGKGSIVTFRPRCFPYISFWASYMYLAWYFTTRSKMTRVLNYVERL